MRKFIIIASLLTFLFAAPSVFADSPPPKKHKWVGIGADLGVPDGGAIGVVVSPYYYWLKVTLSYTNNYFASGARAGVTLDPIKFIIAPTFTTEYGFSAKFNASDTFKSELPGISYEYINFQPGVEFGSPNGFRFFLRAGVTSAWVRAYNFTEVVENSTLTMHDPKAHLWIAPTFKLGFTVLIF
jgi:hypothetical protein